jgi:hypothetical protein
MPRNIAVIVRFSDEERPVLEHVRRAAKEALRTMSTEIALRLTKSVEAERRSRKLPTAQREVTL